jgi:4-amino-4-deoxy-L-arabinose transferase-like glycosyltransferase
MSEAAPPMPDLQRATVAARLAIARPSIGALAIPGLALLSGILYLVNLTVSGYANTYYSMAAQAGSQSWSALFFAALDSQGFITLDKPPLATALMGLSVKLLGLSSWSILLPQALLGIATVIVLYLAVRRSFGERAALLAGVLMAVTPISVLIFRYDNPDALLVFLLVSAAWALGRGLEDGRIRWAILAAALVGFGFLTKYLQAYLVLPAFALAWLVSAPGSVRRRLAGLVAAAVTVAISSLWWVAAVELIPAAQRPYIGGSQTNSALELILGYDGLGRLFGNRPGGSGLSSGLDGLIDGAGGPGPGGPLFGGTAGPLRLFNADFGGQIAWLLPAALLALGVAVALHRRSARTDRRFAGYVLWGSWLLVHAAVFSFMSGIIHPYYSVAMAPAIATLVGGAAVELWERRSTSPPARLALAAGIVSIGLTAWALLGRTPAFLPGVDVAVLALSFAAAVVIAVPPASIGRTLSRAALALALLATIAGPLAYATDTIQTAYADGDPQAGPAVPGALRGGGAPGDIVVTKGDALTTYLRDHRGGARWIVAVQGANDGALIQLYTDEPVMAMGGFTGVDPTPTLAQLQALVRSGELRYVIASNQGPGGPIGPDGGFGPGGGPQGSNQVAAERTAWVMSACSAVAVPGSDVRLYDCAGAA